MIAVRFIGFLFLFLLVLGMILGMQKHTSSKFVVTQGQNFYFQDKAFRSVGVNRYNLLTYTRRGGEHVGCANSFSEKDIDAMFANFQKMGVTTVRFWMFQSFTKSGTDVARMDYVVQKATTHNIKLIPVFENHWDDCTEHDVKSTDWYASGYKSPYGENPLSLKQYISAIVPRYKDNPTILAWEIINEPRDVDEEVLYNFAHDISQHVKAIDRNHLVSIGMAGAYSSDVIYERVYSIETIDYVDYHDYDFERNPLPEPLAHRIAIAKKLNKPLIIGESGIRGNITNRDTLFQNKMDAFLQDSGDIYLIWSYGDIQTTNDGFNFAPNDGVAQMVSRKAQELKK